jgi:hypothetical protein
MGARAEQLARQFEAKAQEVTAVLEQIGEADWKKVTAAEQWSVGVTAHHLAGAHELIAGLVRTVATGGALPGLTMDQLHAMNAKHARDFATCTRAETLELHRKGAGAAAAIVRGIADPDFDRSAVVVAGMPPATAEQLVTRLLCGHVDEHLGSIKRTIGR